MNRNLVVICGKEFASAGVNITKLLDKMKIPSITVAQPMVTKTVLESKADRIALVPLMHKIDPVLLSANSKVKLVHQWGVGLEGVDIPLATANGILVANTPSTELTARASAELAIKLLLDLIRPHCSELNEWGGPRGKLVNSHKIGVLGAYGALGTQVCNVLVNGFNCRNLVKIGRTDSLVKCSEGLDVLIAAAPLTEQTRACINKQVVSAMNPGAIIINVARGPLVHKHDIIQALLHDEKMRFGTDVWWKEPPLTYGEEDDLALLKNRRQVLITPHIGGLTEEAAGLNDERCAHGIQHFFQHGTLSQYCVNTVATTTTVPKLRSQVHPTTLLQRPSRETIQNVFDELVLRFSKHRIVTNATELLRCGTDESLHDPVAPDLVFLPENVDEVVFCVNVCNKYNFPIVPFGAGTCLEGGVAALAGGLCLDMSAMNKVLEVNAKDFDCLVQPGVTRLQLQEELKPTGLFFPVDPGANASLGGMVSTRASGTTAVRYGTMRDRVMGVQAVLANGNVVDTTRVRAMKSSAGLDLTSLFIGSEGTLGVITGIRLKLAPVAESVRSAVARFSNAESAVNAVTTLKQLGVPIARAEFLDASTMRAVRLAGFGGESDMAALFLEFHGTEQGVVEQSSIANQVFTELDGFHSFEESSNEEQRAVLWKSRHNAYYSVMKLRPAGTRGLPTDVCVPISNLYQCMKETWEDIERSGMIAPIFGHVGDGNFHCILLYNKELDGEEGLRKLQEFNDRLVSRALALDGTCTGEHGVGYGKRSWLDLEHGVSTMNLQRTLKRAVDPQGLFNPGKIY